MEPSDFTKEKQLCTTIAARMGLGSQLGVIQFGSQAKVESTLSTKVEEIEKQIEGMNVTLSNVPFTHWCVAMVQVGGGTNLNAAFAHCFTEFELSRYLCCIITHLTHHRFPNNTKHIWIVTDGNYEEVTNTALTAQKLKRQVDIFLSFISFIPFYHSPLTTLPTINPHRNKQLSLQLELGLR